MRRLVAAVMMGGAVFGAMQGANAADMPDFPLRGAFPEGLSATRAVWQGYYIGGQASHGSADADFSTANKDMLAKLMNNIDVETQYKVSEWPLMGKSSNQNSGIGGFVGYNSQWDDVVVGLELNYIHGKFNGSSSGTQTRTFFFPADYYTSVTATSSASVAVKDYGSVRVRGAYAINNYLPYLFGGVALGQADITRSAGYNLFYQYVGSSTPPLPNIGPSAKAVTDVMNSHFIYGYSAGFGVDAMVFANLFVRAEFEYMRFAAPVDTSISTVRVGVGYKF